MAKPSRGDEGCIGQSCARDSDEGYNACLLGLPAECREGLEPETRPIEAAPCFDEALEVLACAR